MSNSKRNRNRTPRADIQRGQAVPRDHQVVSRSRAELSVTSSWQGPLPPPEALEAYDRISPGAAALILENFDRQSRHRQELERTVVFGSERRASRGQWLAASLFLSTVVAGVIVALTSDPRWGTALVVAGLGTGAWIYFIGGRSEHRSPEPNDGDAHH